MNGARTPSDLSSHAVTSSEGTVARNHLNMLAPHLSSSLAPSSPLAPSQPSSLGAAVRRPRAGTLPSTFHLSAGSSLSTDNLLSPSLGSARPDSLRRRLSGIPLGGDSAAGTGSPAQGGAIGSHLHSPLASGSSALDGTLAAPASALGHVARPVGSLDRLSLPGQGPGQAGIPSAAAGKGALTPQEMHESFLRDSLPISPDPVASARLRSGSLTLPPQGLGNAFTPGVFGPPGSWTPRSTSGLSTPLALPNSSTIIPEEAMSPGASSARSPSATSALEEEQAKASIGGILDFLNIDDATSPSHPARSSSRSPAVSSSSSNSLLAPGMRTSGSLSVPSSAHPSIINLRQTFQDHSAAPMSTSASTSSAPDPANSGSLAGSAPSPMLVPASVAARLRANTIATPDPLLRKASPFRHLTISNGSGSAFSSPAPADASIGLPSASGSSTPALLHPTRTLADLTLDENIHLSTTMYESSGGTPLTHGKLLSTNLNRPRASTISILDEASLQAQQQRRRAGTMAGFGSSTSLMRTPLYEGTSASGYMESGGLAEAEEENYRQSSSVDPWESAIPQGIAPTPYSQQDEHYGRPFDALERAATPPPAQASRSLWIGNVDQRITSQDLYNAFGNYGSIDSVRLLHEKECAFINYTSVYDAVRAKDDVLNHHGGKIHTQSSGLVVVRVGFGKAESVPPTPATSLQSRPVNPSQETPSTAQSTQYSAAGDFHPQTSPTRALWIGSIPSNTSHTDLLKVFAPYGAIESARVLVHKQCGFCNFENLDDAVRARKALNGKDILGSEVGPVKIGFAKVRNKAPGIEVQDVDPVDPVMAYQALQRLSGATAVPLEEQLSAGNLENYRSPMALTLAANGLNGISPHSAGALTQSLQPAVGLSPSLVASEFGGKPSSPGVPMPSISEQQVLMRELSGDADDADAQAEAVAAETRAPVMYYASVPPPMEEYAPHHRVRHLDAPRLRDIRKRLEAPAPQVSQAEIDVLASELIDDIIPLSSDYIGNVVVQKLFEKCSSSLRLIMLERIAPYLASIACHKNGTWAAQKIIDVVSTPQEIALVCRSLRPYIPPLLLDQFGNYAAQLCLRFFSPVSDFLYDAIVDRCWEIGSGRFGARSVRTCLEAPNTTYLQQKRVAIAVLLNSVLLATNPNGALLLTWLLDTSNLPGRYRLLATRLAPHLAQLCPHKVASTTILKIINQRVDPQSSSMLVEAILRANDSQILEDILSEQVHGSSFMYKLLGSPHVDPNIREVGVEKVRAILQKSPQHHSPAYAKLCSEVGIAPPVFANQVPQTPGQSGKYSRGLSAHMLGQGTPEGGAHNINPISPPFHFPSFGSPLSPQPRHPSGRGVSPGAERRGQLSGEGLLYGQPSAPFDPYAMQAYSMAGSASPHLTHNRSSHMPSPMMPSLAHGGQYSMYTDQYLQDVAALQMSGFTGHSPYQNHQHPHTVGHQYPSNRPYGRPNHSPTYGTNLHNPLQPSSHTHR